MVENIFSFDKMITPIIIKVIFLLGIIASVIAGFTQFFSEYGSFWYGIMVLIIGPILVRIYCELLIVVFSIHETPQGH